MIRWFTALLLTLFTWMPLQAADFKWMDRDGATNSLESLQGEPVLVHFWASWCPSCRSELPAYAKWVTEHPNLKVLTISLDQKGENAAAFLKKLDVTLPLLLTDENQARKIGAQALPTTIVISADGNIIQAHRGSRNWEDTAFTNRLLKALTPKMQPASLHSSH